MKITLYTIKDCAFSKQEKEYLNTNKLVFEEKDLETNKDFLTEMLAISNNFAGTPVTRVEKDDGTIAVLKGFTKEEFDTVFGFVSPALSSEGLPKEEALPEAGPTDSAISSPSNQVTNNQPSSQSDPLKSVMDNLQSQSGVTTPPVETPSVSPAPSEVPLSPPAVNEPSNQVTNNQATTPPAVDPSAPTIPDFPGK